MSDDKNKKILKLIYDTKFYKEAEVKETKGNKN